MFLPTRLVLVARFLRLADNSMSEEEFKKLSEIALTNTIIYAFLTRFRMGQISERQFFFDCIEALAESNGTLFQMINECMANSTNVHTI